MRKVCTECKKEKGVEAFYKQSGTRGYWSKCKSCVKKQRRKRKDMKWTWETDVFGRKYKKYNKKIQPDSTSYRPRK